MKKERLNINQVGLSSSIFLRKQKSGAGFSVIEIIISSAVFALIVTAFVGSLVYFNKSAVTAGTRARAVFLAVEGLEATRNIRDEDFSNLIDGTYGLAILDGQWVFSGAQDIIDIFTREIEISTIDANTKEINSQVSWDEGSINSGSASLQTHLTNWQIIVEVANSCSDVCQSLGYTNGVCRRNEQKCSKEGEIYEANGDQYCVDGPQTNTCCCVP